MSQRSRPPSVLLTTCPRLLRLIDDSLFRDSFAIQEPTAVFGDVRHMAGTNFYPL
jgi:hypothetical protein